jgi:DNA-binding NarL/FixJ family response regulator
MAKTNILLIDDHAVFRAGMALLLRTSLQEAQVLEAKALDDALHGEMDAPDVVVLDVLLNGLNGLDGIALLKRKWPNAPIILLSSDAAPEKVKTGLARGAVAFLSKEESADTVLATIRQALQLNDAVPFAQDKATASPPRLTPRQSEVLDLLCQGLPNKAIGRKLGLTENTVRWHMQAVLDILQVSTRSEAIYEARRQGLIG